MAKMNEKKTISDLNGEDFIIVTLLDGTIARIKKRDLITIVNANKDGILSSEMYINTLMNKEPDEKDFNLIYETGIYLVLNNYNNYPPESEGRYGLLRITGFDKTLILQEYFANSGEYHIRYYSSSRWLAWRKAIY